VKKEMMMMRVKFSFFFLQISPALSFSFVSMGVCFSWLSLSVVRLLFFVFHRQKMSKQDVTNEHYQYNNEQN
jgi:hypothetical protein